MLPLLNLNDKEFSEIAENAILAAGFEPRSWNDLDVHDPGVTLLDLFAYLKYTQQQYINSIGSKSLLKMLKLLNIEPAPARAARTLGCFESGTRVVLPKGTKTACESSGLVFETKERLVVFDNSINSFIVEKREDKTADEYSVQSAYPYVGEPYRQIQAFAGDNSRFLIGFRNRVEPGLSMYVEVCEPPAPRNPVTEPESFIEMAELYWEYYGEQDGVIDWHPLETEDTTHALLFSGYIKLSPAGVHHSCELHERDGYFIRCTLVRNGYDVLPRLDVIFLNAAELIQKDTACETISFTYDQCKDDTMIFDSALVSPEHLLISNADGAYSVYIEEGGRWLEAESADIQYELIQEGEMYKLSISDTEKISGNVRLILRSPRLKRVENELSAGNGSANQIFFVPRVTECDSFEMMVSERGEDGRIYYSDWEKKRHLDASAPEDKHYVLDCVTGTVQFGDNEHGMAPEASDGGLMILTSYAFTEAAEGNTQAWQITQIADDVWEGTNREQTENGVKVSQPYPAANGIAAETLEEAVLRARADLNEAARAITAQDYERLASQTQGLMLKRVRALPLYKPGLAGYPENTEPNCVTLVFEPAGVFDGVGPDYTNKHSLRVYEQNIMLALEKHRLITTQLYVIPPRRLGLEVYGEIEVKAQYKNAETLVADALKAFIRDGMDDNTGLISIGDIYEVIDALPCTVSVHYIKLELPGEVAPKNQMGDLVLPPNVRVYLKDVFIHLQTSR